MTTGRSAIERPDVVVVVLDCVRASEFLSERSAPAVKAPIFEALQDDSICFEHAVSPSTWSVPSHASLFTGMDPWVHGCHASNDLELNPSILTLAAQLKDEDYRTICLSANPWISLRTGLSRGFEISRHGNWGSWLRSDGKNSSEGESDGGRLGDSSPLASRFLSSRPGAIASIIAHQYPWTLDLVRRTLNNLSPGGDHVPNGAHWIEPTLRQILAKTPSSQSIFCFINLMDAHEPIFLDKDVRSSLSDWLSYYSLPQSFISYARKGKIDSEGMAPLHREYRRSITRLDVRLGRIVRSLLDANRWERTLLVVTSDHGQAFGEGGGVFHSGLPIPARARVPLLIRPPGGNGVRIQRKEWISLTSVKQIIVDFVHGQSTLPSAPGQTTLDSRVTGVGYTCSDGLLRGFPLSSLLSSRSYRRANMIAGAAYFEDRLAVVQAESGAPSLYRVEETGAVGNPVPEGTGSIPEPILEQIKSIANVLVAGRNGGSEGPSRRLERRLESWGYV
jgi:arylsulfatase A-like enzyme